MEPLKLRRIKNNDYKTNKSGDQTGEYVSVEMVNKLVAALADEVLFCFESGNGASENSLALLLEFDAIPTKLK